MAAPARITGVLLLSAVLLLYSGQPTLAARKAYRKQGVSRSHCPDGMFDDRERGGGLAMNGTRNCRPCSLCLPGYEAHRLCTWYDDTECSPCPAGRYSASISRWGACLTCRKCGKHQPVERNCTASSDTVCSQNCLHGYFYSLVDENCLPCSRCQYHGELSQRVQECATAGMDPDMQCWPLPTLVGGDDDYGVPSVTIPRTPATASPQPWEVAGDKGKPAFDLDEGTARIYTVVLLTLLFVVALCVILSIALIVCLCRLVRVTSGRTPRTDKNGYQRISNKTASLLVKEPITCV